VLEYGQHSADVIAVLGSTIHAVTTRDRVPPVETEDGPDAAADDPPPTGTMVDAIARIAENATRLERLAARTAEEAWDRELVLDGEPWTARALLAHAVHDATHHLSDAGRVLRALGAIDGVGATGTVAGLFASGGGVPKAPIREAAIGYRGVDGDRQAARQHHGRVWQALCLWSADVIGELRTEGHRVAPGRAGENVTIDGLDWNLARPGVRLAIGPVRCEVTAYALPCAKNAQWFVDRDFSRMEHERHPGSSRVYASVLRDGVVRPGDAVVVEP
jgi:MOSC domain-containing protein YiiM